MHPPSPHTVRLAGPVAALLGALALAPLHAQERDADTRAPLIEMETIDEGVAGTTQAFAAQVVDDRELESVTLYHRRAGQGPFTRAPMSPLGTSDYFGVSLPTEGDDLRAIEYYVQAIDRAGNRTVSGFAFDPLRRTLRPRAPAVTYGRAPSVELPERPAETSSGGVRWWQVALGVLAVGAIAAFAAGGDDGGGDTVPLTVDLPEPLPR